MTQAKQDHRGAPHVTDAVELEEFRGAPVLAEETAATGDATHHDQYATFTHEVPEETSEAASRVLIRVVPVTYGLLLGGLAGHIVIGLAVGLMVTAFLDLRMGADSLARDASQWLAARVCPGVAAVAHGVAAAIRRTGLKAPAFLTNLRCSAPLS